MSVWLSPTNSTRTSSSLARQLAGGERRAGRRVGDAVEDDGAPRGPCRAGIANLQLPRRVLRQPRPPGTARARATRVAVRVDRIIRMSSNLRLYCRTPARRQRSASVDRHLHVFGAAAEHHRHGLARRRACGAGSRTPAGSPTAASLMRMHDVAFRMPAFAAGESGHEAASPSPPGPGTRSPGPCRTTPCGPPPPAASAQARPAGGGRPPAAGRWLDRVRQRLRPLGQVGDALLHERRHLRRGRPRRSCRPCRSAGGSRRAPP